MYCEQEEERERENCKRAGINFERHQEQKAIAGIRKLKRQHIKQLKHTTL